MRRSHIHRILRTAAVVMASAATTTLSAQSVAPRPIVEGTIWGGYTQFADTPGTSDGAAQLGLRSAELSLWPMHDVRLFAHYDNTLSLDNFALIRAGRSVPLYRVGAQFDWAHRFTTVIDAGRRTLPGDITQTMLSAEQVVFLPWSVALKAGGWVGPRSDARTEWLGHAAISVPVLPRVRVEPTLFIAKGASTGDRQWRGLLAAEARLTSRLELGIGAARGHNTSVTPKYNGTAQSGYARLTLALSSLQRVNILVNRESAPGAKTLLTVAGGLSLRVPRP